MGRKAVNQNDLLISFEVVIAGTEKKGTVLTETEKRLISYHEVGHALIAARQKGTEPVSKITIVPHTQGLWATPCRRRRKRNSSTVREELFSRIRILLGGRAAEEVVFQTATTGASNDIERATDLARKMVTMFGMSDTFWRHGPGHCEEPVPGGGLRHGLCPGDRRHGGPGNPEDSQPVFPGGQDMLRRDRELLEKIAAYLLKKETITGQEMMAIIEGRPPELVDNYGANPNAQAGSLRHAGATHGRRRWRRASR